MTLNSNEIMEVLPHRFPFQLVDRITECVPGQMAVGRKCVTVNEQFFCGHFPQKHVMPGVLILEALAQVAGITVLSMEENRGKLGFFGGIKNARFRRQVVPGDVLELECTIIKQKGPVAVAEAKAVVDGQVAVTAELTLALGK